MAAAPTTLPVDKILVQEGFNARHLNPDDDATKALAESLKLVGILTPLIVSNGGTDYTLVAGHRRLAAAKLAGITDVPVVVRDADTRALDAAVENIAREQLTPAEEAEALRAAIDAGLTDKGAAQALGWSAKRVTERKRILELGDELRPLIGPAFRTDCVGLLIELQAKAPKIVERMLDSVAGDGDPLSLGKLEDWTFSQCWGDASKLDAWPTRGSMTEADVPKMPVKLRDRWRALNDRMDKKPIDHQFQFRFTLDDADVDAARAAGCLVELGSRAIVTSPEIVLLGVERAIDAMEQRVAGARATKKKDVNFVATEKTPDQLLQTAERADNRELIGPASQANEDLARALLAALSSVELTKDVATFFSRAALGPILGSGDYLGMEERRLVEKVAIRVGWAVSDLRTYEKQPPTAGGKECPDKLVYSEPDEAAAWIRKFVEGARTPEEVLGRTLVVWAIATEAHHQAVTKAVEVKARLSDSDLSKGAFAVLTKIVRPHLPGSVKGLRKDIAQRERSRKDLYEEAQTERKAKLAEQYPGEVVGAPDDSAEAGV